MGHSVTDVPALTPSVDPPEPPPIVEATPPPIPDPVPKRRLGNFWTKRKPPTEASAPAAETPRKARTASLRQGRSRRRRRPRAATSSWLVSVFVHVIVLTLLGAATFSTGVRKVVASINSALVHGTKGEEELLHVLATPADRRSDQAVGNEGAMAGSARSDGGGGGFGGIGGGPPSDSPRVDGQGRNVGNGSGQPGLKMIANVSGLNLMPAPARLGLDLGGAGMVSGDVTFDAQDVGEALDQLAREILRHLSQHKLTVVWLFDESESMKDDQRAIREKFDRVASELKINVDAPKKQANALTHAIVGFGGDLHFELERPTNNIDNIGRAIEHLRLDPSGTENTMHAIATVIDHYAGVISRDRRLLLVLVTDESGDDGGFVEEAYQAAKSRHVPIYVIGRQAVFGLEHVHLRYVDPATKQVYWPAIRRGPEAADLEVLQWDGLHERRDEQPSGFAPYELARLAKDSGGIYFLLPSEENIRIHQRETLYSISTLKEYLPDYSSRADYLSNRERSELRRTLHDIIVTIKGTSYRDHFPVLPDALVPAATEAIAAATARLTTLLSMQKRLESLAMNRDREPDKRWQAHYDLMLAQIVAYQIKAFEYIACLNELVKELPRPSKMPTAELAVWWGLGHSRKPKAPQNQTAKKYAEAEHLFKLVQERHPKTPWADLAQDELNRGFSVSRGEHSLPTYQILEREQRAKFVPKY